VIAPLRQPFINVPRRARSARNTKLKARRNRHRGATQNDSRTLGARRNEADRIDSQVGRVVHSSAVRELTIAGLRRRAL
jgi:hypothetical protein